MDKLKKQMDFLMEIDKLKNIFRVSLISDGSRNENDAEHTWHMAMCAIVLEEYAEEGTDMLHCIKMILLHDLVEIYAGDTYCYDVEGLKDKSEREMKAAEKLYSILDKEQESELKRLWLEFENNETKESRFANIVDRVQPVLLNYLSHGETWKGNKITIKQILENRIQPVMNGNPKIAEYIQQILNESVEKGYLLP